MPRLLKQQIVSLPSRAGKLLVANDQFLDLGPEQTSVLLAILGLRDHTLGELMTLRGLHLVLLIVAGSHKHHFADIAGQGLVLLLQSELLLLQLIAELLRHLELLLQVRVFGAQGVQLCLEAMQLVFGTLSLISLLFMILLGFQTVSLSVLELHAQDRDLLAVRAVLLVEALHLLLSCRFLVIELQIQLGKLEVETVSLILHRVVLRQHLRLGVLELLHSATSHVELLLEHGRLRVQLTNFAVQFEA